MTDTYIEKIMINHFINSDSIFIERDNTGKPLNVSLHNTPFNPPASRNYFILTLLLGEPEQAALGTLAGNRHDGIFQIDFMIH